jgi:hypothetical protein
MAYSSTLKNKPTGSSEMSVDFQMINGVKSQKTEIFITTVVGTSYTASLLFFILY